ncbi:PREDICTED: mediator of RNA polymerase II transcription subunit 15 [Nicrophorus vespilloides]|uniref:Mediator of RNA polymerase II transcription subunit 15 n=1 Tax=Nicrophorus vespilloides TaxID=110193 RepID=A0ABM1MVH1_NICVS|nr:PREDICTED: mediator of RNA polymerase II transcription subunit 15 [Nicrophorus vespilloides]
MSDDNWKAPVFRQNVVSKIDEAIRQSGMATTRNSSEMENHVFQKAKTKEEYLGFVARLILHVREMNSKKVAGVNQSGGQGVQDPINALQNLASQGTRNNMMGMNGPQGGPQGPQMQQMQAMPANSQMIQNMNRGPNQVMGRQLIGNVQNHVINANMGQMPGQIQNSMPMQAGIQNQMGNPMQAGIGIPNQMQGQVIQQMHRKPEMNMMNAPNTGFPRNPTPNPFHTQSPTQSVQSPAGLNGPTSNQMVASPALAPSPGSQMLMNQQRPVNMAPSPSSSLNTPGQPTPSPVCMQDEMAYRDKIRQLSKYIEPLTKMIQRTSNDGELEKTSKMKKLLEILSNPQKRMPLETLIKCEVVLEKLDFKRSDGSVPPPAGAGVTLKENPAFNPLLEAINNSLQSSMINHTLYRSFGPTLNALFCPEIRLIPPLKRKRVEEPTGEIPALLQGEIARLNQRFKVSIDPNQQPGSEITHLNCWLDDRSLPCVPPISLTIPADYPYNSPKCHMAAHEYNATQFLSEVQTALLARIKKLPRFFSVSQLLDTWEMSVRKASTPIQVPRNNAMPIAL